MGASAFTAIQQREVIAVQQKGVFKNPHSEERFRNDEGSGNRFPPDTCRR